MHVEAAAAAAAAVAVPNASSTSLGAANCVNSGGPRGGVALADGSAWTARVALRGGAHLTGRRARRRATLVVVALH